MKPWMIYVVAILLSTGSVRAHAADIPSAEVLANTCFACHGTDGVSKGPMPSLAGKDGKYIASHLKAFRDDKAPATIMNRIAKGFTDAEIEAVAGYFDTLKKK